MKRRRLENSSVEDDESAVATAAVQIAGADGYNVAAGNDEASQPGESIRKATRNNLLTDVRWLLGDLNDNPAAAAAYRETRRPARGRIAA